MNRAADGVGLQVGKIQSLRKDALAGESGVAVHHDGDDFVQRFGRAIDVASAQAIARLLGAGTADGDGIDGFQVAWI